VLDEMLVFNIDDMSADSWISIIMFP